jgi:hypothetical protein
MAYQSIAIPRTTWSHPNNLGLTVSLSKRVLYSQAGLPWYEHYGKDQSALPGSVTLAGVKSVANLFKKFTGATLPNSEDVDTGSHKAIGPGAKGPRPVRTASSWDQ